MKVYCTGVAFVKSKKSGKTHQIQANDLEWDVQQVDDRQMGPEICHQAIEEHPELGTLSWSLWEYPEGVLNHCETDVGINELVQDFTYGLEHYPDPNEWVDYGIPDDPFSVFMDSYHRTGDLLAELGSDDGSHVLNRMMFAHQITALEAYLCDTLIKAVFLDPASKERLMRDDTDLSKAKFSLAEISAAPDLVDTTIRDHLRAILYHNLPRVDALYRSALEFGFLKLLADRAPLMKAILYRHDCVHRNGSDKDGNRLTVFTKSYIQEISDRSLELVDAIQAKVRALDSQAFPPTNPQH